LLEPQNIVKLSQGVMQYFLKYIDWNDEMSFLPIDMNDMRERGWEELDFLYISGDAYVDHPSFGHAIISRVLESEGFRVGIIPQPDWKNPESIKIMGRPRLGVLIASGVIDSMVNHYTTSKKQRSDDDYSPGGKVGFRPDRAVIVYSNLAKQVFKDIPVIIGGIEASLRRFAHYDYWDDKVRRSILVDSKADLLLYGMGEKPIVELAKLLDKGASIHKIRDIRGSCYLSSYDDLYKELKEVIDNNRNQGNIGLLESFDEVNTDKIKYASAFKSQYDEQDAITGKVLIQPHGERYLVQNPHAFPMTTQELDKVYALPYERTYHPIYERAGGIPAIKEVEFSITSHRGCYGGCSFCALNFHQSRAIQQRSQASIINEAKKLTWLPNFKGYIHDVGGPTANFRSKACEKQVKHGVCKHKQCLFPEPCKNLEVDHSEYLELLRKVRELPNIKKVFIRSGIRYDYLMLDKNEEFFHELCEHHISGQLKVAPEHVVDRVLEKMGKPKKQVYDRFVKRFYEINKEIGKEQYLVPYMISSHPGSDINAAVELAEYIRDMGYMPEQVQDFYPTPGTLSTCMFYTELDPRTMKKVYVPKSFKEKAMQRALLQFRKKENYKLVLEALKLAGREDLIGFSPNCLIKPLKQDAIAAKKENINNNNKSKDRANTRNNFENKDRRNVKTDNEYKERNNKRNIDKSNIKNKDLDKSGSFEKGKSKTSSNYLNRVKASDKRVSSDRVVGKVKNIVKSEIKYNTKKRGRK